MQPSRALAAPRTGALGFGGRITLCTLFGIRIQLDWSWLLLAVLVTWSLATGFFPPRHPGLAAETYWWMGVVGLLVLGASLLTHELAHYAAFRIMPRRSAFLKIGAQSQRGMSA